MLNELKNWRQNVCCLYKKSEYSGITQRIGLFKNLQLSFKKLSEQFPFYSALVVEQTDKRGDISNFCHNCNSDLYIQVSRKTPMLLSET